VAYLVVDTDVSSQILRDRLPSPLATQLVGKTLCATFVTVAELTQWAEMHTWGAHRKLALTQWLASLLVLPYNEREDDTVLEDVARTWGEISARARLRGRPRPQNDTWIAATCLVYGLPLATLNAKDFADFAEHDGLTLVTS
jgi:predicted nucleic acid-binding protein